MWWKPNQDSMLHRLRNTAAFIAVPHASQQSNQNTGLFFSAGRSQNFGIIVPGAIWAHALTWKLAEPASTGDKHSTDLLGNFRPPRDLQIAARSVAAIERYCVLALTAAYGRLLTAASQQ
jgi:hypothetical protein